ncbi:MAG: hypothetical protein IT463_01930 [Planctomycetes bacterium]|nr:hypothetical protein [Planctomycetota bacterium]
MTELLEAHLQGRLEPGRRPTTILFLPQIPQDSSGKTRVIELKRLAERARKGAATDDEEE